MEITGGAENISVSADGITGEYAPEPLEEQVPRTRGSGLGAVSYTHLTLPTILLV